MPPNEHVSKKDVKMIQNRSVFSLFSLAPPFAGRHAELALEDAGEVLGRCKAIHKRDLTDRLCAHMRLLQMHCGASHPEVVEVLHDA